MAYNVLIVEDQEMPRQRTLPPYRMLPERSLTVKAIR